MAEFEPKQFGKYYLLEKLAVGGMAEIYKAKTFGVDGFEKLLVIKRILPHCSADKDFITMLVDEAKLSVALSHANIVQVYDLGKVGNDYFISMEYINGVNLRDVMYRCREQNKKVPEEVTVYIASEICKGLDYAHRKTDSSGEPLGIVHRDVSPQNILISYEGEVKIVDFGIAKAAMNISHTMAGILKGKIAYMSPEQALGKAVDYRTDIFSAGIILHEALLSEKLFTGESQFEVLKKIRSTKIDTSKLPETMPEGLKNTLAKSLAYYPKDRYQSAGDMQIDLTKFLYTSHIDFTPQKLASFIKELFANEIASQRDRGVLEAALEAQTSSINIAQEALQENIVHREDTAHTVKIGDDREDTGVSITGKEPAKSTSSKKPVGKRIANLAAVAVLLAGLGFAYAKFIHPRLTGAPAAPITATGTINISSDPSGANILLNGKDTELTTPAILENLAQNKAYVIKLSKKEFADAKQEVTLTSTEPLNISMKLEAAMGTLEIVSEPAEAAISVDGEPTGENTPATLTGLALNTDLKIVLSKPEYKNFEQVVKLTSAAPQKIVGKLALSTGFGSIKVASDPAGAQVFLNGRDTEAVTPANLIDIPVGEKQNVRLMKLGFESTTDSITLENAEPVTISNKLVPSKTAAPLPIAQPTKPAKPAQPAKLAKPTQPAKPAPAQTPSYGADAASATLRIASDPNGAEIFINGEYKGTTPTTISGIKPGTVSLLINKEGKSRSSQAVSLSPGESKDMGTVKLGELYGSVSITSSPSRASVIFDGEDIGAKTPVTVKKVRRDKQHSVKLNLEGYKVWERNFDMEGANEKKFNITLEKE